MKLHTVVTAVDNNPLYLEFVPVFCAAWKKLFPEINIKIIHISSRNEYTKHPDVIHFQEIQGVHPAFQSQCIRLLWPSLIGHDEAVEVNDCVLITDIDMIPMNTRYYTNILDNISNDQFICFRNIISHAGQYPICYNAATPATWSELFNVRTSSDIKDILTYWFSQTNYDGKHGGQGWSFDQSILFQTANVWERNQNKLGRTRLVLLNDQQTGFKRLDRLHAEAIINLLPTVIKLTSQGEFSDFHLLRPYPEYRDTIDRIVAAL